MSNEIDNFPKVLISVLFERGTRSASRVLELEFLLSERGKPSERVGRKATDLTPEEPIRESGFTGHGSRAAGLAHLTFRQCIASAREKQPGRFQCVTIFQDKT